MSKDQAQAQPEENPNCAVAIESPAFTIALLNARVGCMQEANEALITLTHRRALRIERLEAELHMERQELRKYAFALDAGREVLHVFTADPEEFIRYLRGRSVCAWDTVSKLLAFIQANLFDPKDGNPPVGRIAREEIASRVEVVLLTLQTLAHTLDGEPLVVPALPHDAALLDDWLATMRESVARKDRKPEPQEVYYCETCKRHVAAEDVRPYYPDVPTYTGGEHYHAKAAGGCGEKVTKGLRED